MSTIFMGKFIDFAGFIMLKFIIEFPSLHKTYMSAVVAVALLNVRYFRPRNG